MRPPTRNPSLDELDQEFDYEIWRYLPDSRALDQFQNSYLWMSCIRCLREECDGNEGWPGDLAVARRVFEVLNYDSERFKKEFDFRREALFMDLKYLFDHTYVSCWRACGDESFMFDNYADDGCGVAVKTTAKKLIENLPVVFGGVSYSHFPYKNHHDWTISLGRVEYSDAYLGPIPSGGPSPRGDADEDVRPFFRKGLDYSQEREFRLLFQHSKSIKWPEGFSVPASHTEEMNELEKRSMRDAQDHHHRNSPPGVFVDFDWGSAISELRPGPNLSREAFRRIENSF